MFDSSRIQEAMDISITTLPLQYLCKERAAVSNGNAAYYFSYVTLQVLALNFVIVSLSDITR